MDEKNLLAGRFEAHRAHLRGVAYRMLGSLPEAEDAVQEAWLRLSRAGDDEVQNLRAWLTTVVARVCLDMLRARTARREESLEAETPERAPRRVAPSDPEQEMLMAESVGLALLVVLQTLPPAERIAFVLHDMFDLSFEEIGFVLDRSPAASRQLASRGRRRVQGKPAVPNAELSRQRQVVDAFLAACRAGDFETLLSLLDPDVVFRADQMAVRMGALAEIRGAAAVANTFKGRAAGARPALVDGAIGMLVAPRGKLRVALKLTFAGGRIAEIEAVAEPDRLRALQIGAPGA